MAAPLKEIASPDGLTETEAIAALKQANERECDENACKNIQSPLLTPNSLAPGDITPNELLRFLKSILGFYIALEGNIVTLRSVYAFSEEDIFKLEIQGSRIVLLETDHLKEWAEYVRIYLHNGQSLPAFFAAVILDQWNKSTFN